MTEDKPKRRRSRRKTAPAPEKKAPEIAPEKKAAPEHTIYEVSLDEALQLTGVTFGVSPVALQAQAEKTPHLEIGFPTPTLSIAERRFLFALVRVVQPYRIVEFGTGWGASMTSIAAAAALNLRNNRRDYHISSVDKAALLENAHPIGANIPAELRTKVNFVNTDALIWLGQQSGKELDFVFEDADHSYELTRAIYEGALRHMRSGAFIISHDACHISDGIGKPIRRAIESNGIQPLYFRIDGSRHGLAVCRVR